MKNVIIGTYSDLSYTIDYINADGARDTVYKAGNSPFDSQGYLPADKGVGLKKMREFCDQTAREFAEDKGVKYYGILYKPSLDLELEPAH